MEAFIKDGIYYELTNPGDPYDLPAGAIEVPKRPADDMVWLGSTWGSPAVSKEGLLAYLSDLRWQRETGGIDVGGMAVPTDDRSKLLINGALAQAQLQEDDAIERTFKLDGVFVTVTNAQLIAIGEAIADHVQRCFDAEGIVAAQIDAATVTTIEGVQAAFDGGIA